jgi:hypothetical protein
MEYISPSWSNIPELVNPNVISFHLIEGCCSQRSYWTKGSWWWSCVCLLCLSLSCVWCLWVFYSWLSLLFSLTFISDISFLRHFIVPLFYYCDTHLLWHCNIPTFLSSHFQLYMCRHYFIVYIQHCFSAFIIIYHIWSVIKRLRFVVITKLIENA